MARPRFHPYSGFLRVSPNDVEVQQAESELPAIRAPVAGFGELQRQHRTAFSAQTRDVSARGICFYMDAPLTTGSEIEFTLTLPLKLL